MSIQAAIEKRARQNVGQEKEAYFTSAVRGTVGGAVGGGLAGGVAGAAGAPAGSRGEGFWAGAKPGAAIGAGTGLLMSPLRKHIADELTKGRIPPRALMAETGLDLATLAAQLRTGYGAGKSVPQKTATAETHEKTAAALHTAAERGQSLAKEAMAQPELRPLIESMTKESFLGFGGTRAADTLRNVGTAALGTAIGAGVIGLANMGLRGAERAVKGLTEGRAKSKAMGEMLRVHKQLGAEDKDKVQQAFNSLYQWHPDAAHDPLMAGSFVQKVIDYGTVTTKDVQELVSTRKALRDAQSRESIFSGPFQMRADDPGFAAQRLLTPNYPHTSTSPKMKAT